MTPFASKRNLLSPVTSVYQQAPSTSCEITLPSAHSHSPQALLHGFGAFPFPSPSSYNPVCSLIQLKKPTCLKRGEEQVSGGQNSKPLERLSRHPNSSTSHGVPGCKHVAWAPQFAFASLICPAVSLSRTPNSVTRHRLIMTEHTKHRRHCVWK